MKPYQAYEEEFCIRQERFSEKCEKHYEGIFTQGSGYLHLRGSYEEGLSDADQSEEYTRLPANVTLEKSRSPLSKWGTYLPGVTGRHPLLREEIVNLPYPAAFSVEAEGIPLDMAKCQIINYSRWLDMRDGVLYRFFNWKVKENVILQASYRRFVSVKRKDLLVQEIEFTVFGGPCTLTMYHDIDEQVKTNGYEHFITKEKTIRENKIELFCETDNGDKIGMCSLAWCNDENNGEKFKPCGNKCVLEKVLTQGDKIRVKKLTGVLNEADSGTEDRRKGLYDRVQDAADHFNELYEEHQRLWAQRWEKSQIKIEGNPQDQKVLNFAVYHLLRCGNQKDSRAAICAKGFSGEAYFGHFFWDTEIYLLPFYLHTDPETAMRLERFRVKTLPGAKANAQAYGYRGARYPWESSVTGEEQCPNWQYADHEVHVTADVVFGMWHVWKATGDEQFFKECVPVFVETARFWMDRVESREGSVNVNGVMGPDEYVCLCNNNAYTNEMIAKSLEYTLMALAWAQENAPVLYGSLGLEEGEAGEFRRCAKALKVLGNRKGIIPQCDHFDELEEPHFPRLWKDKSKPFGQFISQERNYRTKALKQADVLMLPYLFPHEMHRDQVRANYKYYEPYTTHDSSLSAVVHGIVCAQLGETEEAYTFFQKACSIDMGDAAEETGGGAAEGVHIANCGGLWQAVVYGFAGMDYCYENEELSFHPRLPEAWKSLSFPVCWNGKYYQVKIMGEDVEIKSLEKDK